MVEQVKRKRGRPRKNPLPDELQKLISDTQNKSESKPESKAEEQETRVPLEEYSSTKQPSNSVEWDVPIDQEIKYFDASLSYELTGYKPINETEGLDFNPDWFTEARDTFNRTGHYTEYRNGSKAFSDFWREQYRRCRDGLTVNGYTITGDHYFFLNFYRLENNDPDSLREAGASRTMIFPNFMEGQYQWFHYLSMAKKLRLNACMMKAREAGYSQIEAAIIAKNYTVNRGSINVCCAFAQTQLDKLLDKVWSALSFLDNNTDGGFSKGRVIDTALLKKSGQFKMINGVKTPTGWGSIIQGIVVDRPGKLRGDRTDILMFEEFGLWPNSLKAYTQADALVGQIGNQFGVRLIGGTGGESGPQMEGLRKMYYDPEIYGVLPFKHNYTQTGDYTISAFFLPAFKTVKQVSLYDHRGYISDKVGKEFFDRVREIKSRDPEEFVTYCAEFCYNAEEAFSLEGQNKFNKVHIAEQLTRIRALKQCPPIETGYLEYTFKEGKHVEENINGFRWIPNQNGKIQILEHPIWTLQQKVDSDGKVVWSPPSEKIKNLYVIGIDGIDIGKSQTSEHTKDPSDFCLVVYKRAYGLDEPQFVAIYKDRPNDVRECYKIAIKLAQYYNATINIEATRQGIIPYARDRKLLKLFMKRPRATLQDSAVNTNKQYGTPATTAIIDHQTDLIADYVNDYCHLIWFDEMLDELNRYSDENKRKFDIVASMAMALLADEELRGMVPKMVETKIDTWQDIGYYTDENGNRRYGAIPKQDNQIRVNNNFGQLYDNIGIRTSDPRILSEYLW